MKILLLCVISLFTSCAKSPTENISSHPFYKDKIGCIYKTTKDMQFGAMGPKGLNVLPDYYFICTLPRVVGRRITSKGTLEAGTRIRINNVLKEESIFRTYVFYVVDIMNGFWEGKEARMICFVNEKQMADGQSVQILSKEYFVESP